MDFDKLLKEMETLNEHIQESRSKLDDELEERKITEEKLAETVKSLDKHANMIKALEDQKRALDQQLQISKRNIDAISARLGKMIIEANNLKDQMIAGICTLADQHIGQQDGAWLLNGQLAVIRIKTNGKLITRLVPVSRSRSRASPHPPSVDTPPEI